MSERREQSWPGSWPPFWRGALHVMIATGVGNVLQAVCVAVGVLVWGEVNYDEWSVLLSPLVLSLTVGLVGWLRLGWCGRAARLVVAVVLTSTIAAILMWPTGGLACLAAIGLFVLLYAVLVPRARRWPRLAAAWGTGTVLHVLACVWVVVCMPDPIFHACVICGAPRSEAAAIAFVQSISSYVFRPFAYAVVAAMLISLAPTTPRDGGPRRPEAAGT